jgi:glycine oxidase
VMATGHHRNGILLTPITARSVSDYVLTGQLPESVQPFTPERFLTPQLHSAERLGPATATEAR